VRCAVPFRCVLTLLQAQQTLDELQKKMNEQLSNAAALNSAMASAASASAAAELHTVEQQLQESKRAAAASQTAFEESEKQLKQAVSQGEGVQKQLQLAEAAAAAAAASAASAAEQLKAGYDALQVKFEACDAQLTACRDQSSSAAAASALAILEIQASCDSYKQSAAALQQDLDSTRDSLSAAETASAAAASRCQSLQNELSLSQTSLADARAIAEADAAKIQELEMKAAEVERLHNELEECRAQIVVVQKKSADNIRQLQREVTRQKSLTDSGGGAAAMAGAMGAGAELSPVHPASIKITELEAQVALLKEDLERKKRMLSEIAEGGAGSGVMLRGAHATSGSANSPASANREDSGEKGVGSKLMSGFKKGGMAALTLGGLIPHKSSPKPDAAAHSIDQEKMNAMEAMLEETVMTNNKLQRELVKVCTARAAIVASH
jgi:hypothetical protein